MAQNRGPGPGLGPLKWAIFRAHFEAPFWALPGGLLASTPSHVGQIEALLARRAPKRGPNMAQKEVKIPLF